MHQECLRSRGGLAKGKEGFQAKGTPAISGGLAKDTDWGWSILKLSEGPLFQVSPQPGLVDLGLLYSEGEFICGICGTALLSSPSLPMYTGSETMEAFLFTHVAVPGGCFWLPYSLHVVVKGPMFLLSHATPSISMASFCLHSEAEGKGSMEEAQVAPEKS